MMKKNEKITDNKNPFKVPEGYFEEVNKKIISVTSGESFTKSKSGFYHRIRPYLLVAASVAVFIMLGYTASRLMTPHRTVRNESGLFREVLDSQYLNDLDIYSIENAVSVAVPEQGPDVSKAEIIDYLLLENIEINEIFEQL
jgi:hypothetical protein